MADAMTQPFNRLSHGFVTQLGTPVVCCWSLAVARDLFGYAVFS